MFEIYVDDDLLYSPVLAGDGYAVTAAEITVEIGGAGMASIDLPPTNPLYSSIKKMRSIVRFVQDGAEIFRGRVLQDSKDFFKIKHLSIEGELAFLIDYVMPPYDMTATAETFFRTIINIYNSQVGQGSKQLTVGTVGITGTRRYKNIEYSTIQDAIYNELVDPNGGFLRIRVEGGVRYIDLLSAYSHICEQKIIFGENLLDIEDYISAEDTCTVVIPLGAMQYDSAGNPTGRLSLKTASTPHEYVSDPAAELIYGNIWKIVIFEEVTDRATLRTMGQAYLDEHKAAINTISVSGIDLYDAGFDAEKISLGDFVKVESAPHGIDGLFQCVRIETDLLNPANSVFTFGNPEKTFTEMQTATDRTLSGSVESMSGDVSQAVLEAKAYTVETVNAATNAYTSDASAIYDATAIPSAYADILDAVSGKQYRTTSGGAFRLGLTAQDLSAAMTAAGITSPAIVSTDASGAQVVNYDQLVPVLWEIIKDLKARVEALEGE